jgi:hypothetical protein
MRFALPAVRLIIFRMSDRGLCIFTNDIIGLDLSKNRVEIDPILSLKLLRSISDARLSPDETFVALSIEADPENKAEIRIYRVDPLKGLVSVSTIEEILSPVQVMDFSSDNMFLMYKETLAQKVFYDLLNFKKNDTLGQNFDPPFSSTGLALSPSVSALNRYQSQEHFFTALARIGQKSLLVADSLGTLRVFAFPCKDAPWHKIYTDHIGPLSVLKVSVNQQMVLTASSYDR